MTALDEDVVVDVDMSLGIPCQTITGECGNEATWQLAMSCGTEECPDQVLKLCDEHARKEKSRQAILANGRRGLMCRWCHWEPLRVDWSPI
jgi:hypothetical protein